jgi:hypothetical protein
LGVVCSAAESVAAPGAALFSVLVEEQPAVTNIKAADRANPIIFFKSIPPMSLDGNRAIPLAQLTFGR